MAKEQNFPHPPRGHVALLAYDSVNDRFQVVHVDATGLLQVDVADSGGVTLDDLRVLLVDILDELLLIDDLRGALNSVATDELDVVLDGQNADVEVTQTTPADLVVAQHQYDGSAWRKSNLLWGYHDNWLESEVTQLAGAGDYTWDATTVPSGEVWVAMAAVGLNATRNPSYVQFSIVRNSDLYILDQVLAPGANTAAVWSGQVPLKAGDTFRIVVAAGQLNDWARANVIGYKMDIAM